ncbi:MAG: hypothetical protein WDW36_006713 [Sanguina aurantia]
MATGGWGGLSGGAWGAKPVDTDEVELQSNSAKRPPPQNKGGAYGAQPEQQSDYTPPAVQPVARSTPSGAYGQANGKNSNSQSFNSPQSFNTMDIRAREDALNRREAELNAREAALKAGGTGEIQKKKNWPRCIPMLHHDIPGEIPERSRRVVREAYFAWYGLLLCLTWNLFCASVMLGYKQADQRIASWFLAIVYFITGVPLSFYLWYLKIYNGAKNDSTFGFIGFFALFAIHVAFCTWAAIAFPFSSEQWSFAGFVTAIKAFDISAFAGIIYIVGASLWTLEALFSLWVLKDVFFFFRGQGGVQQAKQQAAVAAFKMSVASGNAGAGANRV